MFTVLLPLTEPDCPWGSVTVASVFVVFPVLVTEPDSVMVLPLGSV